MIDQDADIKLPRDLANPASALSDRATQPGDTLSMDNYLNLLIGATGWNWLIAAAIFFALDVLAPGFFLLWFGFAAAAVAALVFVVPLPPHWQIIAFCTASVASLLIGRKLWGGANEDTSDKPLLNQRARQLIGRVFVLKTAIQGGEGRVYAGDGVWSVRGPDMPAGKLVRVTDADGTVLIVEAAEGA
ncbi:MULTISPECIES: NfeD family protein [Rhodomicrobium]|uniref:NfeD family protein n=1 Tax=Rhodomicrobium TaxID=1068 RepID=UPI001AEC8FEF|nr:MULTISPECIES: NfeD family protein [Rhodomicrobium]